MGLNFRVYGLRDLPLGGTSYNRRAPLEGGRLE